jgi:hypothetical protein
VGLIVLGVTSLYRMVRRSQWNLAVPTAGLVAGMVVLDLSSRHMVRYTVARGGIEWGHPGDAIKQLAGAAYYEITDITATTFTRHGSWSYDLWRMAPVVSILVVGLSAALLIRRMPIGIGGLRAAQIAMVGLTSLMGVLMGSYLVWFIGADVRVFGGHDSFEAVAFITMLFAGSVGLACARSSWRAGHFHVAD